MDNHETDGPLYAAEMTAAFAELFQAHGVEALVEGDWIVLPQQHIRANAAITRSFDFETYQSVQLDVRVHIGFGRVVIESFAGAGDTTAKAIHDALASFSENSLHVLLRAFCSVEYPEAITEEWVIGKKTRQVTTGGIGVRGEYPHAIDAAPDWFARFQERVKEKWLADGIHWVRLYFAQQQGKVMACEVLLDNEPWLKVQSEMATVNWPKSEAFYSVRHFMVITGGFEVSRAVATMYRVREEDDTTIIRTLIESGLTRCDAEKVLAFTPLAFGRILLKRIRVQTSATAQLIDTATGVAKTIRLSDDPFFHAAHLLAEQAAQNRAISGEEWEKLALRSAEVLAFNEAVTAGYRPSDSLTCMPPTIYLTPEGGQESEMAGQVEVCLHARQVICR